MRTAFKWFFRIVGSLLLIAVTVAGLFVAFNWTLVRNLGKTVGAPIETVDRFEPHAEVAGCGVRDLPVVPDGQAAISAEALAKIQTISDSFGGKGLIVLHDGRIVLESYAKGFDATTRFETFSMHKSVVGLIIGNAISDGVLPSVDAKASAYLPEWANDERKDITLRDLLTMSSGIKYYSIMKSEMPALNLALSSKVEKTAIASPQDVPRNTVFAYNNASPQIAGAVLRRALTAAGKGSYADYLSSSLWCPLGNGPARLWLESEDGAPRFYAHLQASVRDWARIGQMIADGGKVGDKQVVSAQWLAEMTAPSATNPNYGLQIWRGSPWPKEGRRYSKQIASVVPHKEPYRADDVVFFDGFGGQRVYIVPSARLVIARVGDPSMTWEDSGMVNAAIAGIVQPAAAPLSQPPAEPRP
jgi:CubicO group peptidase (beta-lactamase class C family)